MLEVSPNDLRGRVDHHVRRAVLDATALPTPEMASQGSMRAMLERADLAYARHRNLDCLNPRRAAAGPRRRHDRP
ncbi:MAG: hypothetical protein INR70_37140 [Parafilimonas terrae]|nr:hypothetical protein [Parafilimonas terrae]